MRSWHRRRVLKLLAGAGGLLLAGCHHINLKRKQRPRVVVIGAGFGGATAAKYLRLLNPEIEVILIERKRSFITCPFSNTVLADINEMEKITHSYQTLTDHHGVNIVHASVIAVDAEKRSVWLDNGDQIPYDKLIVSPGIDMRWVELEGYNQQASSIMPHAWQAGEQTLLLKRQLQTMNDGGLVVISAPANPYRCPPGPYERAAMIAHYLKQHKPRSKVLILDSKNSFAKQAQFELGWQRLYPGMIEWIPLSEGGRVVAVDAKLGRVYTEIDEFKPAVANIIPPQHAGHIAHQAGLTDDTGWCPVNQQTFESDNIPGIYIIGDSSLAGAMPKSAYAANNQAKVCVQAIIAELRGEPAPTPSLLNTCYSLLAPDYAISVAAVYRLAHGEITPVEGAGGVTPIDASREVLALEANYTQGWYANIIADSFH